MKDLKIFAKTVEQTAQDQINRLLEQEPFENCKVRIMPDVHAGAGCVIGFTADLGDKIVPNLIGVDIGCGMYVEKWPVYGGYMPSLEGLDKVIRNFIPSGKEVHEELSYYASESADIIKQLHCYEHLTNLNRLYNSLGTLGGGNHFIELDVKPIKSGWSHNEVYLIIHSGSRNLGKQVAEFYQKKAIDRFYFNEEQFRVWQKFLITRLKAEGRETEIEAELKKLKQEQKAEWNNISIPKELCYLEGKDALMYMHDMVLVQQWARRNREIMAEIIRKNMGISALESFHCTHNYLGSDGIIRKGAISAHKGEPVLIPLNMKDGCIFGYGKGNEDWNNSAPHGAGRIMGRGEARRKLSLEDYQNSMNGIYTTSVGIDTIDEAPQAYKPAEEILSVIGETVEIEAIWKPIYNFKAKE